MLVTGMQNAARRIQRTWKRYKSRVLWSYVRRLPVKVAVALIRTYGGKKSEDAPTSGLLAAQRREMLRLKEEEARRPVVDAEGVRSDLMAMGRLKRQSSTTLAIPNVPLSGPQYEVKQETMDALRAHVLSHFNRLQAPPAKK